MSFGTRLKEAREAKRLNQKELGALIGVSGNSISNYEQGVSSPNDATLLKIFNALDVEPNFLFQDSFEQKEKPDVSVELSDAHHILLDRVNQMTDEQAARFVQVLDAFLKM